jgi:hypothetical protein
VVQEIEPLGSKKSHTYTSISRTGLVCGFSLAFLLMLAPRFAFASLGGNLSSVVADQIQFQGSLKSAQMESFTVHEIRVQTGVQAAASAGAVIREYISPAGTVFAVTWQGDRLPNMRQLLGSYFQEFVNAVKQQSSLHPGRRPLQIVQPDFVVQMNGHVRFYSGKAYLPGMLPPSVKPEAIQ